LAVTVTRDAYAGAAEGWATDADVVYRPLAERLVGACPVALDGVLALDAGAGTGAASAVLVARGARVVAVDREPSMLAHQSHWRPPAAAADLTALPIATDACDVAVAAFVLNHVAEPAGGLGELARVVRPGGVVLASTFGAQRDPAKAAFDALAAEHGWVPPPWSELVHRYQAAFGTPDAVVSAARRAGLVRIDVTISRVTLPDIDGDRFVRYRLAMPQYRAWRSGLDGDRLEHVRVAAVAAVGPDLSFAPEVIELVAAVG
jgi:SAM-dependent methyltransferase